MHSKNARANQSVDIEVDILHVRSYHARAPPSAKLLTFQFALSSLSCLPCNDICVQIIRSGMSQIQPEGRPTLQFLGIWIENQVENNHYRFVLKVKSHNERKSIYRPLLTRVRSVHCYFLPSHANNEAKSGSRSDVTTLWLMM